MSASHFAGDRIKSRLPNGDSKLEEYEIFKDVGYIVTDIDGTLIAGSESVMKQIKKNIRSLKRKKVQVTVATGRTYYGAKKLMQELDIKIGTPVALYNGGIVVEYGTGNLLYSSSIPIDVVEEIISLIDLKVANVYIYTFAISMNAFQSTADEKIVENVYELGADYKERDVNGKTLCRISDIGEIDAPINAVLIGKKNIPPKTTNEIKKKLEGSVDISCTDSGNGFIEMKGAGQDKGIIFDILKEINNMNRISCQKMKYLAIGDNDNDKELFRHADISIAVANASVIAMTEADYICENDSASGFLDILNVIKRAKTFCGDMKK